MRLYTRKPASKCKASTLNPGIRRPWTLNVFYSMEAGNFNLKAMCSTPYSGVFDLPNVDFLTFPRVKTKVSFQS